MIEIEKLGVCYKNGDMKTKVLSDLNANICKGEIYAIIGPSGGGKSTLLKVLSGIITDYEGKVLIDGCRINPRAYRIGFVPQNYGLIRWKTTEQNMSLPCRIKDGKGNIDPEFYKKILRKLQIEDLKKKYPEQLSGGQKQRVSIAGALLLKPDLLLMDEPFTALDALTKEMAQEVFLAAWRELKVTTILVTHDIDEAIYLGMRIAIFSSGPGKIIKTFKNHFFGNNSSKFGKEYSILNKKIRQTLKGE